MKQIYLLLACLLAALMLLWLPLPQWMAGLPLLGALLVLPNLRRHLHEKGLDSLAATVFRTSGNGILISDSRNVVLAINPAFTEITGYTTADIVGKNPNMLGSGQNPPEFYQQLWQALKTVGMWQGEIRNRKKSGEIYVEWLTINVVKNAQGEITHHIAVFSDITERKLRAERVEYLASHDGLTGLPNRVMFDELLNKVLANARREQTMAAVLFLDLDKFKLVNDTLGHAVGDELLKNVAKALQGLLRAGDVVARQGGDEFTMALPNLSSAQDACQLAEKILRTLEQPCTLQGQKMVVTISIGISLYPQDGQDIPILLKHADIALYRAKKAGRNNYQLYNPAHLELPPEIKVINGQQ